MNKDFAKLYTHAEMGQVVVSLDSDDNGEPCVSTRFQLKDGAFCNYKIGFPDTDEGYENRNKAFDKWTEEMAFTLVNSVIKDRTND